MSYVKNIIPVVAFGVVEVGDLAAQALSVRFDQIGLEQGLSQSTVNAIVQDAQGFMWFGTQDGLNRYDAYSITVFKHDPSDSTSISDNAIWCLVSDRNGDVWVGTEHGGLNRYVISEDRFYHYRHDPNDSTTISDNYVRCLFEDSNQDIWIGTRNNGLNRYNRATGTFTRFLSDDKDITSLSSNHVWAICEDHSRNLWIATSRGLSQLRGDGQDWVSNAPRFVRYYDIASDPNSLSSNNTRALYVDSSGTLWIGTQGGGLNRFDEKTRSFKRYLHDAKDPNSVPSNFIWSIYEDSKGLLWTATYDAGLSMFDFRTDTFVGYNNDEVLTIYKDLSGILWFGTFASGVKTYDQRKNWFKHHSDDPSNASGNAAFAILEDRDDELWVGTYGNGLKRYAPPNKVGDRRLKKTYVFNPRNQNSLGSNKVISLCESSDGSIWTGTTGGLNRFNKRTGIITRFRHESGNHDSIGFDVITSLHEDSSGRMWIGNDIGGIGIFHRLTNTFEHLKPDDKNPHTLLGTSIGAIYEDKQKTIWVGTFGGGLHRYAPETHSFYRISIPLETSPVGSIGAGAHANTVCTIAEDDSGFIWFGMMGIGLIRYDQSNDSFAFYTQKHGLPNDNIWGILPDKSGNLWLSTNKGISKFNLKTKQFKNYNVQDGLQSNEFNRGSYFVSSRRELFFGGMNGVTAFFPESIRDNEYVPPVYLTSFRVLDKSLELPTSISSTKQVELSYSENFFSFGFVALNYTSPEKNQYAYMLEGFDNDWHKVSAQQRYASYTNIDPGEYVLRVKASNNDGLWNETGTSIVIVVTPPFWMTWWFRMLLTAGVIGLVVAVHNYRVAQLLKIERIRVQIATDLHDEIGSSLGSIVLRSRTLQKEKRWTKRSKEELARIHRTAMQTAGMLRDIVWLVNPDFDKLDDMILRMKDTAQSLLAGISYEFIAPDEVLLTRLSPEIRRIIFLSYKEILHNIAKHSKATEARIEVYTVNGMFHLEVSDNGMGFDINSNTASGGTGLKNVRKRMAVVEGQVDIQSAPNQGTTIALRAKTTQTRS